MALAFAFLHLPTYLSAPIAGAGALRDLSVMVIVIPFAICFRIHLLLQPHPVQRPHRRPPPSPPSTKRLKSSPQTCQNPLAQVLALASVGLLAFFFWVITKGTLAYNRDNSPVGHQVA